MLGLRGANGLNSFAFGLRVDLLGWTGGGGPGDGTGVGSGAGGDVDAGERSELPHSEGAGGAGWNSKRD